MGNFPAFLSAQGFQHPLDSRFDHNCLNGSSRRRLPSPASPFPNSKYASDLPDFKGLNAI
jgi:hypothetical protein